MPLRSLAPILLLLALSGAVQASEPPRTHPITPEDFFSLEGIAQLSLSHDGKQAAWVQSYWDKAADKQRKDLWRIALPKGTPERLTFTEEDEAHPQFSPDGRFLYFSKAGSAGKHEQAPHKGKRQIFRLTLASGEVVPLTREGEGIKAFQLSANGQALWYTGINTHHSDDPFAALRKRHDKPEYGHGQVKTNPLYRLDLATYRRETIIDDDQVVWAFDISPDDQRIARIITAENGLVQLEGWSDVAIYDRQRDHHQILDDQRWRAEAPSPYGWLMQPRWSQDGRHLAFRIDYDGYPGQLLAVPFDHDGRPGSVLDLARQGDVTLYGDNLAWRPNSHEICYRGSEHGRIRVYCTELRGDQPGSVRALTQGDYVIKQFSFAANGKQIGMIHNGLDHFDELYSGKIGKTPARRTWLNPHTAQWQLPQIEIVHWTAPDGQRVEGILELPHDYRRGDGPLPLVVQLHGGPTSATPYALQHRTYGRSTFAAKGWALFSPNYRGSTGYGDRFLVDLVGREHDIEVKDIEAGVDRLIADGIADPDRLAVMGWSNGGYLTNALISTTTRYRAASSGAGVWDQRLQWLLEDTPGHVVNFMQGLPWEQPEAYQHGSSLSRADQIQTPTLIHMGENDARVPAPHAKGLYRALRQYLNVPTELLIYPDEGHGLSRYQHKLTKMQWDLAWFEHYVLGEGPKE
ncbi:S9 family peptidase [Ferrimonas pelagia]|uniref:Peptidase S9 prolyl oligopeptidase catalytic domain-containing protein n=1 Tax=Ferrimonas pelagia TaxID=1177826 RepID=A0ABP9EXL1_9GAMM